jgi:membrane carboxypeptidase/penicillin-binding protein
VIETTLDAGLQVAATQAVRAGLEDLDHRQGYRGPLRKVTRDQFADEIARLSDKNDLPPAANGAPSPDDVAFVLAGRVVARGTHRDLLASHPGYRETVTRGEEQ